MFERWLPEGILLRILCNPYTCASWKDFVRCILKRKRYLFFERFQGCRKTLSMPQITSVVSKLVGPGDRRQPTVSLPDDHTQSSLYCVIENTADVVSSSLCGLLTAPWRVTGENHPHNAGGYWAVFKSWKSRPLLFALAPAVSNPCGKEAHRGESQGRAIAVC